MHVKLHIAFFDQRSNVLMQSPSWKPGEPQSMVDPTYKLTVIAQSICGNSGGARDSWCVSDVSARFKAR